MAIWDGNAVGGGTWAVTQVTVGPGGALLAGTRAGRQGVNVTVLGAVDVYLGPTSGVSSTNGVLLVGIYGSSRFIQTTAAVFAVCAVSQTVSVEEFYG